MASKNRDDPWKRSGTQRDHSIGSDFGSDGKHKGGRNKSRSPEEKPAEQTDFFGMGPTSTTNNNNNAGGFSNNNNTGGFDFDFGMPASNPKPAVQNNAIDGFDFGMPSTAPVNQA